MTPAYVANLILVVHALYVGFVVLSVPLIVTGGWRGWVWVRNPWFRYIHLAMIGFVVLELTINMTCPLTVWEHEARLASGSAQRDAQDFIAYWVGRLLFYNFPPWVFGVIYVGFGALVAALFYFVPVRRFRPAPCRAAHPPESSTGR